MAEVLPTSITMIGRVHATEKRVARTVACYRSGMNGYGWCDHSHRQPSSKADRLALIFLGAVTRIGEATFAQ